MIKLYGRAGPLGKIQVTRKTSENDLAIEYSTQRGLNFISDHGLIEAWRDLHVEAGPQPQPAPCWYEPLLANRDALLHEEYPLRFEREPTELIEAVTSFGLRRDVYEVVLARWVDLAGAHPEFHPLMTDGLPNSTPISRKEASKQLASIKAAANDLFQSLRKAHPLVAEAIEAARAEAGCSELLPPFAKVAGFVATLDYVAQHAGDGELLNSLPSQLKKGRPTDWMAEALRPVRERSLVKETSPTRAASSLLP